MCRETVTVLEPIKRVLPTLEEEVRQRHADELAALREQVATLTREREVFVLCSATLPLEIPEYRGVFSTLDKAQSVMERESSTPLTEIVGEWKFLSTIGVRGAWERQTVSHWHSGDRTVIWRIFLEVTDYWYKSD